MKKIFYIFIISFLLNFVWENLHAFLYAGYQGGKITEFILFRASLGDAVIITALLFPFLSSPRDSSEERRRVEWFKKQTWLIVVLGVIISILIEWYALRTGRWAYNSLMPILPFLNVGLTPTIQLGMLGYFSYWIVERKN